MPETTIASFILRFTQEHTADTEPAPGVWRGVIRHIQTNEELRFTRIESALGFIARYVDTAAAILEEEGSERRS
jgi:hypothetical protein